MPTYNEELKRDIYRDLAAKQHLSMRMARTGRVSACDAAEEETAPDYCARIMKKLGLPDSRDPVMALTMFLEGHDRAIQRASGIKASALDGVSSGDSLTERFRAFRARTQKE